MANEVRLIDANALAKEIDYEYDLKYGEILTDPRRFAEMVEDAPTVDAVEVVHGRNLAAENPSLFECSACHWSCNDTYYGDTADYNYCPNCGARMDGDLGG